MEEYGYSWRNARYGSSFLLPRSEHFGRWVLMAVIMGVLFHGALYYALEKIPVLVEYFNDSDKMESDPAEMTMVSHPQKAIETPEPRSIDAPPEDPLKVSKEIAEIEDVMDEAIIDPEIDINLVDIKMQAPALSGDALADQFEPVRGPDLELDIPELGRNNALLDNPLSADIKVDTGQAVADIFDPDKFTRDMVKKGADGQSAEGLLKGFTTLEDMKKLSGNALENAKALIGSDLLFEFGKSELKSSARHSLMAVAFLIDKNTEMFCVLNGHTDMFGDAVKNKELSLKRAEAVRTWLVNSVLIDPKRVIVIGHGKNKPIVKQGDRNAQAINRRVVIEMKRNAPKVVEESIPAAIPAAIPRAVEEIPRANPAQP